MVHVIIQQIIFQEVLIMMYMPSLFGENLVDDFFDNFDHDWFTRPVQGRQAASLMRTDIRESDHDFTMAIELPGYKKEDLKL
jgi:HSP20 family molecular chaperone IbpA